MRLHPGHLRRPQCAPQQILMLPVLLMLCACATTLPFDGQVEILATSRDQPLTGAECIVTTDSGNWTVQTPGQAPVGAVNGDLRVVCNKAGYRTSEVIHRNSGGRLSSGATRVGVGIGGGVGTHSGVGVSLGFGFPVAGGRSDYPSKVIVDMTPLP